MNRNILEEILEKNNLVNLKEKRFVKRLINLLSEYKKNEYIYPKELYWLYRKDKDFIYTVLDILEKENILKKNIFLRCCKCGREKIISTYLMKNEEIICDKCGTDNDDRDCIVAYQVL